MQLGKYMFIMLCKETCETYWHKCFSWLSVRLTDKSTSAVLYKNIIIMDIHVLDTVCQYNLTTKQLVLFYILFYEEITLTKFTARYGEVFWKDGPLLDSLGIGWGFGIYEVYALLDGFVNGWFFFVNDFWNFAGNYTMLPTILHR